MTYSEVLTYYLNKFGVSQSELARRMGTGRQTINSLIKGDRRGPTLETALEIAAALGISLQEMVDKMQESTDA